MAAKQGELHHKVRLTLTDVLTIRELYANGQYSQNKLGELFGVGQSTVRDIVMRRTWQNV